MKKLLLMGLLSVGVLFGVGAALADAPMIFDAAGDIAYNPDALAFLGMAGILVNKSSISSVFTGLKTIFNNALKAAPGNWQATAMEVLSTGKMEDYSWLSRFPMMRKWIGEKHVKALEAGKYTAINEDWETTISVDRNDIQDDHLGHYQAQANMAADSAAELPDIIVDELKNNAFTTNGIDGQFFYDTDHEVNRASVSNKLTAVLSSATRAAADASIGAARTAMMTFTDDEGSPLRLVPDTLEVPPALEATANTLANSDKLGDNSPNPYKGTFKVVVNAGLTSTTAWMLHNTKKAVKPFILQMRKRPVFVSQTSMENDDVFNKREFKFGAEARATGVYGFWQLSVGSTGV